MKKLFVILFLLSFVLGCQDGDDSSEEDLDVFKENSNGTALVTNTSASDLVLFLGGVKADHLIGGVKGSAVDFRMNISNDKGLYIVNVITYNDYKNNINDLGLSKIVSSAVAYVDDVDTYILVSSRDLGEGIAEFKNETDNWVEIHLDSYSGPVITAIESMGISTVYLKAITYRFYPVLRVPVYSGSSLVELRSVNDSEGLAQRDVVAGPENMQIITIKTNPEPLHLAGYLHIRNETEEGLELRNSGNVIFTALGRRTINPGELLVYNIEGNDSEGVLYSNFTLNPLKPQSYSIDPLSIKNGFVYNVVIKSDFSFNYGETVPVD